MNDHLTIKDIFIHKYLTESRDWTSPMPRKKHYLAYQKEGTVIHRMNDGRVFNAAPDTVHFPFTSISFALRAASQPGRPARGFFLFSFSSVPQPPFGRPA